MGVIGFGVGVRGGYVPFYHGLHAVEQRASTPTTFECPPVPSLLRLTQQALDHFAEQTFYELARL